MKDVKTLIYLLILSTFLISMMALLASADTGIGTNAKSSALYNPDTKSFLYQKNADMKLPMASTTKIVTGLIALETLNFDEVVRVPKEAVGIEGSSLYLKENDEITVGDLIYSLLLQSANDAATALAIRVSGDVDAFASKMNERVQMMGAYSTQFKNPHGLDSEGHYTTAHDLSIIASEALKNDAFKKITSTYKHTFKIGEETRTVVNHNKLIKRYEGCIGVKTGYTKKSGRCLVSAAEKNGITLIAVTLNDTDDWNDHQQLLDYGFDNLQSVDLNDIISIPDYIPTISEDGEKLKIKLSRNFVVKSNDEKVKYKLDIPYYIAQDVKIGDKIGEVYLTIGNREEKIDVLADNTVKIKNKAKRFF